MKLYISPGACSLSPHIVFREAGIPFDMETVDLGTKRTKSGKDFKAINPKGSVPAGTMDRYRLQDWLNYVTSEMHKSVGSLFNPKMPDDYREITKTNIGNRLDFLSKALQGKDYLMGSTFTVADY